MRILIVEDEFVSREKIHAIMKNFGDCTVVDGGRVAVISFKNALQNNSPFHVVTLDISMPDMDGKDVLRQIRDAERAANITHENRSKVIMLTAHADRDNIQGSLRADCDDYLLKPFNKELVEEKLKNLKLINALSVKC